MAAITLDSKVYVSGLTVSIFNGTAGSTISKGTPCYIDSNSKVLTSACALVDDAGNDMFVGVALNDAPVGEPVSLALLGTTVHLSNAGLTVGSRYYSGSTAGALVDSTAQASSRHEPIAKAVTSSDVLIVRPAY